MMMKAGDGGVHDVSLAEIFDERKRVLLVRRILLINLISSSRVIARELFVSFVRIGRVEYLGYL